MRLRLKLALMLAVAVVPVVVLFSVFRYYAEEQGRRDHIATQIATRHVQRLQLQCARDPESFQFQDLRLRAYAYRPDLSSANPDAPPFPEPLAEELSESNHSGVVTSWDTDTIVGREVDVGLTAVEVKNARPECSVFVISWRQSFGPPDRPILLRVVGQAAVAAVVLLALGLFVGGTIVGRIRRLTREVGEVGGEEHRVEVEVDAGDEIGDLARAFNRASDQIRKTIDKLEDRDHALREYVANVTHDLAVPVTVLQHRLSKLKRDAIEGKTVRVELIDSALEEAQYLSSMISNVGMFARLDAGDGHILHEVDLREVIRRVGARFELRAEQRGVEFNWAVPDEPALIEADSTLVEQAVGNCVQNAIQYNVEGGHVGLVLDRLESSAGGYRIRIVDDGPGVPEATLDLLTDRLFRDEEARSRRPEGHGVGLSITRRVVEIHDWELRFANREEGGLEVTITVRE